MQILIRQFGGFAMVGLAGFVVDTGITVALADIGWDPLHARIPGLTLAILLTWAANRWLTFPASAVRPAQSLMRYTAVALGAAVVNFAVYSMLVVPLGSIVFAILAATAVSMMSSFIGYRYFVFGDRAG